MATAPISAGMAAGLHGPLVKGTLRVVDRRPGHGQDGAMVDERDAHRRRVFKEALKTRLVHRVAGRQHRDHAPLEQVPQLLVMGRVEHRSVAWAAPVAKSVLVNGGHPRAAADDQLGFGDRRAAPNNGRPAGWSACRTKPWPRPRSAPQRTSRRSCSTRAPPLRCGAAPLRRFCNRYIIGSTPQESRSALG